MAQKDMLPSEGRMTKISTFLVGQNCCSAVKSWAARRPAKDVKIFVMPPPRNRRFRAFQSDCFCYAWGAMRLFCLICWLACLNTGVRGADIVFNFSEDAPGQIPPGFVSLVTGPGKAADWKVTNEEVAPLLAPLSDQARKTVATRSVLAVQSPNPGQDHFPLLLYTNELFSDFTFSTRFKILGGTVDSLAGLVYRAQDQGNYYVVRASTEGNLLWFRVVGGKSYEMLGIGVKIPVPKDLWQELKIECSGSQTRCFLDGKLVIPPPKPGAPSDSLALSDTTFSSGKIGFWCEGDTACHFVDARVHYTPKVPLAQTVVESVKKEYPRLLALQIYADKQPGSPVIVGDADAAQLGKPGSQYEEDVIQRGFIYYLPTRHWVEVTMPLRDRNGEVTAAMKTRMDTFRGETRDTSVARALIVKKAVEKRMSAFQDIGQ